MVMEREIHHSIGSFEIMAKKMGSLPQLFMGVDWVSTGIKACNGSLRTTVRLRAPPPTKG